MQTQITCRQTHQEHSRLWAPLEKIVTLCSFDFLSYLSEVILQMMVHRMNESADVTGCYWLLSYQYNLSCPYLYPVYESGFKDRNCLHCHYTALLTACEVSYECFA